MSFWHSAKEARPRKMGTKPSTYAAIFLWVAVAFTAQPTVGSFIVHFTAVPFGFFVLIWLAHWEGYNLKE